MLHRTMIIKKIDTTVSYWKNLEKNKKIDDYSVKEIIQKYNGFEGKCLNFYSSEKFSAEFLYEIKKYLEIYQNLKSDQYIMLYVINPKEIIDISIQKKAKLIGYDFGYCKDELNLYSSVFNEIIFGFDDRLIKYQEQLNENLLFKTYESVVEYSKLHHKLYVEGVGVEYDLDMDFFEIWKFSI